MSTGDRRWGVRAYDYWRDYDRQGQTTWSGYPLRASRRSQSPLARPQSPPRPRPPPPEPESSRRRAGPDAGYLALAAQPSTTPDGSSRKLLVLDLNGTLLVRGPRQRTSRFGSQTGRLRSVYPRPYMPAFREYLFTSETREWLDTMVWSSAQPHSVQDMVDRVFGADSDALVAVWDRKSLGLSSAEYHQKTATTKDLSKPWQFLRLDISPDVVDLETESSTLNPTLHSALTTLLLDDSPHKAVLQPYNHVCIPEYDSPRRKLDLDALAVGRLELRTESGSQLDYHRCEPGLRVNRQATWSDAAQVDTESLDPTLLAVVGILDEIKRQSNVAGWIRAGGLWGKGNNSHAAASPSAASPLLSKQTQSSHEQPTESAKRRGKRRQSEVVTTTGFGQTPDDGDDSAGNDAYTTSELATATTSETKLGSSSLWFEDPSTVAYWVARGRRALDELGIASEHGVSS
ncbi:hypothetical protein PISMIDRAFT_672343 [Pisolithus microcarpus 441]|uniref:Mitochondrial import inner membrane translocase subunit TIM50 n=1 Tax=Pisolithus microcarpus 441 TaxID=765257 RepID=A0A0C9ZJZ1_9AGAM|nr:hypothetical protein BKA83DRAFT_672343 [Pisolithus microcarpus]KIK29606.1 hypothetical protein PISMIDRAFT_672343 [Pisolithus microcarpus 441]